MKRRGKAAITSDLAFLEPIIREVEESFFRYLLRKVGFPHRRIIGRNWFDCQTKSQFEALRERVSNDFPGWQISFTSSEVLLYQK